MIVGRRGGLAAVAIAAAATALGRQQPAPTSPTRVIPPTAVWTVAGQVTRAAPHGPPVPVGRSWVLLHRVGSDTAGPIDSVRSGMNGRFRFRYRHTGSADAVYFLSARHDGIVYFSSPLETQHATGAAAAIEVFDTTSAPVPLHVRGRHLILGAPAVDGTRDVVEVYELSNDSSVTRISPDDAHPTWTALLPPGATDFRAGQSDVSPNAIRAADGRVMVVAPFAPGLKQLSFEYALPPSSFPLAVPMQRPTEVLEVLTEETHAVASGARLASVAPVAIQGRRFARWLAHDVPASGVMRVAVPAMPASAGKRRLYVEVIAIVVGAAMLVSLAAAFARRARRGGAVAPAPGAPPGAGEPPDDPEAIACAIADLDADFERRGDVTAAERSTYASRRALLRDRLARALDARRRPV